MAFIDRTKTKHFGFNVDFGTFQFKATEGDGSGLGNAGFMFGDHFDRRMLLAR